MKRTKVQKSSTTKSRVLHCCIEQGKITFFVYLRTFMWTEYFQRRRADCKEKRKKYRRTREREIHTEKESCTRKKFRHFILNIMLWVDVLRMDRWIFYCLPQKCGEKSGKDIKSVFFFLLSYIFCLHFIRAPYAFFLHEY